MLERSSAVEMHDRLARLVSDSEPEALRQIIWRCLKDEISPAVAVMGLLIHTQDVGRVERLLEAIADRLSALPCTAGERQRSAEAHRLFRENRDGCVRITQMLQAGLGLGAPAGSSEDSIADCARFFDWAMEHSAEASVALYSLGSPQLLQAATAEVVALLDEWQVLAPERAVLQIGCGIGRFEAALSSRVREVHGIDVSPGMVEAARRRCLGLGNVHIQACSGRDLALFGPATFDLVYTVDTFPYLYQAGMTVVERHFAEVSRVLKPGGDFVILNFTYRGNPEADRQDIQELARRQGFEVRVDGSCPLRLWDGRAWWLRSLHR